MHDKVKAYAGMAVVALAGLIIGDHLFNVDIVPEDTEKLFWTGLVPVVVGGVAAFFTREGHGPTK